MKQLTNDVQFLVRLAFVIVFSKLITYFVFCLFLAQVNRKSIKKAFNNYVILRGWVGLFVFRDDP